MVKVQKIKEKVPKQQNMITSTKWARQNGPLLKHSGGVRRKKTILQPEICEIVRYTVFLQKEHFWYLHLWLHNQCNPYLLKCFSWGQLMQCYNRHQLLYNPVWSLFSNSVHRRKDTNSFPPKPPLRLNHHTGSSCWHLSESFNNNGIICSNE